MRFIKKIFWFFIAPFVYTWSLCNNFYFTVTIIKVKIISRWIKLQTKFKLFFLDIKTKILYKLVHQKLRIILFFTETKWPGIFISLFFIYIFISLSDLAMSLDEHELSKILLQIAVEDLAWDEADVERYTKGELDQIFSHLFGWVCAIVFIMIPLYLFSDRTERSHTHDSWLYYLYFYTSSGDEYEWYWNVFLAYLGAVITPLTIFIGASIYLFVHGIHMEIEIEEEDEDEEEDYLEIWLDPVGEIETADFMDFVSQGRKKGLLSFIDGVTYASDFILEEDDLFFGDEELYSAVGNLEKANQVREQRKGGGSRLDVEIELKSKYPYFFNESTFEPLIKGASVDYIDPLDHANMSQQPHPEYENSPKQLPSAYNLYVGENDSAYPSDDIELLFFDYKEHNNISRSFSGGLSSFVVYRDEKQKEAANALDPSILNWADDWFIKDMAPIPEEEAETLELISNRTVFGHTRWRYKDFDEILFDRILPLRHNAAFITFHRFALFVKKDRPKPVLPKIIKEDFSTYKFANELEHTLYKTLKDKQQSKYSLYSLELDFSDFIGKHPQIAKYLLLEYLVSVYEKLKYNTKQDFIFHKKKRWSKDVIKSSFLYRRYTYRKDKIKHYTRKLRLLFTRFQQWRSCRKLKKEIKWNTRLTKILQKLRKRREKLQERIQSGKWYNISNWFRLRVMLWSYIRWYFALLWKVGADITKEDSFIKVALWEWGTYVRLQGWEFLEYRMVYYWFESRISYVFRLFWQCLRSLTVDRIWVVGPYSVYNPTNRYYIKEYLNSKYEVRTFYWYTTYKRVKEDPIEECKWKELSLRFANKIHKVDNKRFFRKISFEKL